MGGLCILRFFRPVLHCYLWPVQSSLVACSQCTLFPHSFSVQHGKHDLERCLNGLNYRDIKFLNFRTLHPLLNLKYPNSVLWCPITRKIGVRIQHWCAATRDGNYLFIVLLHLFQKCTVHLYSLGKREFVSRLFYCYLLNLYSALLPQGAQGFEVTGHFLHSSPLCFGFSETLFIKCYAFMGCCCCCCYNYCCCY